MPIDMSGRRHLGVSRHEAVSYLCEIEQYGVSSGRGPPRLKRAVGRNYLTHLLPNERYAAPCV